uniref:Uncharacterized protein n=1 Tax=Zea mays TaxID=4577 RepID=A0A804R381_MAIZE
MVAPFLAPGGELAPHSCSPNLHFPVAATSHGRQPSAMDAEPPLFSAFLYSPCVAVRVRCLYKCSRGVTCHGQPFWRRRMFDVLCIPSTTPSTIGEEETEHVVVMVAALLLSSWSLHQRRVAEQWNQNTGHFPTSRLDAIQLISSLRYCNGRDCSYVLLVLFRLYGQRNRSYYTREIEDTILLALQKPEVYDDIARATCCKFGIDRPQVVPVQGLPQV